MAQRLQAAKRAAAARGELRTPLPVGYVHDELGAVVIDPDAEVRPRSVICSPRSPRAGRPTGWSPRSPGGGSRCAPTAECGPGSCAGAGCHPCPGPGRAEEPVLRRGVRARPLHLSAHASTRTAACTPGSSNGPAPSGRCSSATITTATSAGPTTWPTRPGWPPTAPTPGRAHHARDRRCVRASSPADPAASRCAPTTTPTNARPTSARAAPIGTPPRRAARSPRPPSTTRSPSGCWPR